jgi:hypothetical protein
VPPPQSQPRALENSAFRERLERIFVVRRRKDVVIGEPRFHGRQIRRFVRAKRFGTSAQRFDRSHE